MAINAIMNGLFVSIDYWSLIIGDRLVIFTYGSGSKYLAWPIFNGLARCAWASVAGTPLRATHGSPTAGRSVGKYPKCSLLAGDPPIKTAGALVVDYKQSIFSSRSS